MKKLLLITLVCCSFLVQNSYALDATGTIDEYKTCTTGDHWRIILFKVSGNWFGMYISHYKPANVGVTDYDYIGASMVMQAFASSHIVNVRANGGWPAHMATCGDSTGQLVHGAQGDYMHIVRQ